MMQVKQVMDLAKGTIGQAPAMAAGIAGVELVRQFAPTALKKMPMVKDLVGVGLGTVAAAATQRTRAKQLAAGAIGMVTAMTYAYAPTVAGYLRRAIAKFLPGRDASASAGAYLPAGTSQYAGGAYLPASTVRPQAVVMTQRRANPFG